MNFAMLWVCTLICCLAVMWPTFAFKCPDLSKLSEDNDTAPVVSQLTNVCLCLSKQRKIVCRLRNYTVDSFALVKDYFSFLQSFLYYDKTHLNKLAFMLCINTQYRARQTPPIIHVGPEMMFTVRFDQITISYCDQRHQNPLVLDLDSHFLAYQTVFLRRLEVEIPLTSQSYGTEILNKMAHAVMRLKRLDQLVVWLAEDLYLSVPSRLFAIYSPIYCQVPIKEVTFANYHLKDYDQSGHLVVYNETISIGSHVFSNLPQLELVAFQNVLIDTVEEYAFAWLESNFTVSNRVLTINFTNVNLAKSNFKQNSLSQIRRPATIYIDFHDELVASTSQAFIPTENMFGQFLMESEHNRLKFGYKINCANIKLVKQFEWMFEDRVNISAEQIELYCTNGRHIFRQHQIESQTLT